MSDKYTEMVHEHLRAENHSCSAKLADELHQSAASMLHKDHCRHLHENQTGTKEPSVLDITPVKEAANLEPFLGFSYSDGSHEPVYFNHNGILEETKEPVIRVNEQPKAHHEPESEWTIGIKYHF